MLLIDLQSPWQRGDHVVKSDLALASALAMYQAYPCQVSNLLTTVQELVLLATAG